jgi:hypothetical protein
LAKARVLIRQAVALGEHVDAGLVTGHRDATELDPTFDHDEERSRRIVLPAYDLVLAQREHGRPSPTGGQLASFFSPQIMRMPGTSRQLCNLR